MVLSRVRELVSYPGKVVNKAHLYDQLVELGDPSSSRQTLQILVKYSRSMKDLLKGILKLMPPRGTPRRIFDSCPPGLPTATLYEVVGEVKLVPMVQTCVGPNQLAGTLRPHESGKIPHREKIHVPEQTRSSQIHRKRTERSATLGRAQSPNLLRGKTPKRSMTLERAMTPKRMRTPERTRTPYCGKAPVAQASKAPALDCMLLEQWRPLLHKQCQLRNIGRLQLLVAKTWNGQQRATTRPVRARPRRRRCWPRRVSNRVTERGKVRRL